MKSFALFILMVITTHFSYAQNVDILDTAFLYALIDEGVDTNGDNLISYTEAKAIKNLNVHYKNISDITGIEAFINLDTLDCSWNEIESINISGCTDLIVIDSRLNQLTSLDVSNNTALKFIDCSGNELTSLDVSNNTDLETLYCYDNQLDSLDVSNNT